MADFTSRLLTFDHKLAGINTAWADFFALLHLSKRKRKEVSITTVLVEAVHDFCSTARKMNWLHLSETPSRYPVVSKK